MVTHLHFEINNGIDFKWKSDPIKRLYKYNNNCPVTAARASALPSSSLKSFDSQLRISATHTRTSTSVNYNKKYTNCARRQC